MKLIKKLLPVATLGSVAAVVVPLSTSCTNGNAVSFDGLVPPDTTGWKICEEENLNVVEATDEYAATIEEDNSVFYNDFCFGKGLQASLLALLESQSQSTLTVNKYSGTVSDFVIGDNSSYASMSYKAEIDIDTYWIGNGFLTSSLPALRKQELTTNLHCSIEVNNVPFFIDQFSYPDFEQRLTVFAFPFCDYYEYGREILPNLTDDWSITISAKGDAVKKTITSTGEETVVKTKINEWQTRNNNYFNNLSFVNGNLDQFGTYFVSSFIHYFVNTNIAGI